MLLQKNLSSTLFLQLRMNNSYPCKCQITFNNKEKVLGSTISILVLYKLVWLVLVHLFVLDSRFSEYQHVNLGMLKIILDVRTFFVTLFPDFHILLSDLYQIKALKIQVYIFRVPQDEDTARATLHYQIVWQEQNQSMNLTSPTCKKSLFLHINTIKRTIECIKIPRHISRDEQYGIFLDLWIASYEKLRDYP